MSDHTGIATETQSKDTENTEKDINFFDGINLLKANKSCQGFFLCELNDFFRALRGKGFYTFLYGK